jgi:hypothetical protein
VKRRIIGRESDLAVEVGGRIRELEKSIAAMLTELTPNDFEAIVDMTFMASGWRRQGGVGGTEEDVDLVLVRSSIGGLDDSLSGQNNLERVGVQIKSEATTKVFNEVAEKLGNAYSRSLFIYHSGQIDNSQFPKVELVDAVRLAPMILDAGLTRWLLRRVR